MSYSRFVPGDHRTTLATAGPPAVKARTPGARSGSAGVWMRSNCRRYTMPGRRLDRETAYKALSCREAMLFGYYMASDGPQAAIQAAAFLGRLHGIDSSAASPG